MDKISVIVPVYNGEKYLRRCIDSLIKQSYTNNEYIFVNDGSTDGTLNILKKYQDPRIVIIDKKNTGVSDSRNKAISKASGDYICFCDADDIYDVNYIKNMHDLMIKENVSLVRCNFKVIDEEGNQIDKGNILMGKYGPNDIRKKIIPSCLDGSIPCFTYLLMIKKNILNSKFPTDLSMMEDVVFYIDLLLKSENIYITEDCLYTIMFNNLGATNNVNNYERNIEHVVLVNEKVNKLLSENNLATNDNILKLNVNNLNSIADFIFRYYLYGAAPINFCQNISNDKLINLIKNTDLSKINFQRRILLRLISGRHYFLLKVYFSLRKIIFSFKRR